MKMPKLSVALWSLFIALSSSSAFALQLGQITAQSYLGDPLNARIEVYGLNAGQTPTLTIKPDITLSRGSAVREVIKGLDLQLIRQPGFAPYVQITSAAPINELALSFRLRASDSQTTTIQHYSLTLTPRQYTRPPSGARRAQTSSVESQTINTAPATTINAGDQQTYGPVRSGQTLHRIMRELGLPRDQFAELANQIVLLNPHGFSNGNADRLRVGVMLEIPGRQVSPSSEVQAAQSTTPTSATLSESIAPSEPSTRDSSTAAKFSDPQTIARLAAVSAKFAAIKARYAEQQKLAQASETTVTPTLSTEAETPSTKLADKPSTAVREVVANDEPVAEAPIAVTQPASAQVNEGATTNWLMMALWAVAAVVAFVLLTRLIMFATTRWHQRRELSAARAGDRAMVEEIARKAEQRLKLEDEVKRRISANRGTTEKTSERETHGNTIERSVDQLAGDVASLEEIENRIAHGQYAEAEAMLNQVIAKTPNNGRAKLRLAEIYYLNERTDEFVALAADISANHRDDVGDDGWQRVMRMGKVIAPERPPFSGPVSVENRA